MKTPEEMAEEYADTKHDYNPNFPRDVQHNFDVWQDSKENFLAGYHTAYNLAYELGFESALKTQKIIKFFEQRREKGNENS